MTAYASQRNTRMSRITAVTGMTGAVKDQPAQAPKTTLITKSRKYLIVPIKLHVVSFSFKLLALKVELCFIMLNKIPSWSKSVVLKFLKTLACTFQLL
jgi:hypothetical protein